MDRKPVRGTNEEGGRSQLREHEWMHARDAERSDKARRGAPLAHDERMRRAIDEGVQ